MKTILPCLIAAVWLFAWSGEARAAEITGTVYLYAAGKQRPTPLAGYEIKIYDLEEKKWLNTSITDASGKYAFYGIPEKQFIMTVGKSGAVWQQVEWQQEVSAPGVVKPIVLAQTADIVPHAAYTERKGEKDKYDFSLWLDVPAEQQAGIQRVVYTFNNPTFKQKEYASTDAASGFKVGYTGWGCLDTVHIKIERRGVNSYIIFKMCDALKPKW